MGTKIDGAKISSSLSKIQKGLEDIRARCISDPDDCKDVSFEIQKQLQAAESKVETAEDYQLFQVLHLIDPPAANLNLSKTSSAKITQRQSPLASLI